MCWIVLSALLGPLCFQIWVLISAPFGSLCSQVFICMRLAPRVIVMSALVGSLSSQLFTYASQVGVVMFARAAPKFKKSMGLTSNIDLLFVSNCLGSTLVFFKGELLGAQGSGGLCRRAGNLKRRRWLISVARHKKCVCCEGLVFDPSFLRFKFRRFFLLNVLDVCEVFAKCNK